MYDIITVGSATRDIFVWTATKTRKRMFCYPVGTKILVNSIDFHTGGGGTNAAVSLARKGLKTGWVGMLGRDDNGRYISNLLKFEKVDFLGNFGNEMTGVSIILDSRTKRDRTILAYKGINNSLKNIDYKKLRTKWLYFCSMEGQSFKTLEKLAGYAKGKKIKVMFNPSSYLAKKGMNYLKKIISATDILVVNREEAQYLAGKGSTDSLLKRLQNHAKIVIITQGPKGASAYNGIQKFTIKPRNIKIIETTGAGDAFSSGVLAGIVLKNDLEYALKLGQANAEAVIQHAGAKNKLIRLNEANKIIKKLRVKVE